MRELQGHLQGSMHYNVQQSNSDQHPESDASQQPMVRKIPNSYSRGSLPHAAVLGDGVDMAHSELQAPVASRTARADCVDHAHAQHSFEDRPPNEQLRHHPELLLDDSRRSQTATVAGAHIEMPAQSGQGQGRSNRFPANDRTSTQRLVLSCVLHGMHWC